MDRKNIFKTFENQSFMNHPERPIVTLDASGRFQSYVDTLPAPETPGNGIPDSQAVDSSGATQPGYWAYFDELNPVQKLCIVVFDDIKKKSVNNEEQVHSASEQ